MLSLYSVQIGENTDQKNSDYEHFSDSDFFGRFVTSVYKEVLLKVHEVNVSNVQYFLHILGISFWLIIENRYYLQ